METRANHVLVGVVTLALLAALALAIVWIARLGEGEQKQYDIFFKQSVAGLANGSQVSFAGVPVGKVDEIVLWDQTRVWIYSADRPFNEAAAYRPTRNPHFNDSNYRSTVSLPSPVGGR